MCKQMEPSQGASVALSVVLDPDHHSWAVVDVRLYSCSEKSEKLSAELIPHHHESGVEVLSPFRPLSFPFSETCSPVGFFPLRYLATVLIDLKSPLALALLALRRNLLALKRNLLALKRNLLALRRNPLALRRNLLVARGKLLVVPMAPGYAPCAVVELFDSFLRKLATVLTGPVHTLRNDSRIARPFVVDRTSLVAMSMYDDSLHSLEDLNHRRECSRVPSLETGLLVL